MATKIAVIGAGIVGSTASYYLSKEPNIELTIFDEGVGQGTKASAGIISPWLSRRRNKKWYRMVKEAAAFYPDFLNQVMEGEPVPSNVYNKVGTLLFKSNPSYLDDMLDIGLKRREDAPEIGELAILSPEEIQDKIPIYDKDNSAVWASGGAKVDGSQLVNLLLEKVKENQATIIEERADLTVLDNGEYQVASERHTDTFDKVVLANAAWLGQTLEPLGYDVDIRPQKGQLAELEYDFNYNTDSKDWPVVMPEGESDIIPFDDGKIVIGATHEDEMGYDLEVTPELLASMIESANKAFSSIISADSVTNYRTGTRAYTSDYAPFFGHVPNLNNVVAASGLGSTGLTAGPLVGKILYELITNQKPSLPLDDYPISNYIQLK